MARTLKPPTELTINQGERCVFLAGSIDLDLAENWQARVEQALMHTDLLILNPRRDNWDNSWEQRIDNPQFRAQVEWELVAQERADRILMYLAPATHALISLLELGLFARSGRLVVCCPPGFWRKGNVDIVCARYGVPMVDTLDELCAYAVALASS